jgi:fluoride ion exporter CrcB/FEX
VWGWKVPAWLPLGTLVANLVACAAGYVLLTVKSEAGLERTGLAIVDAFVDGTLGSLSTASTWSAEVRLSLEMLPCVD